MSIEPSPPPSSSSTSSTSSLLPPFSLNGDKYDQNTYYGRFRKMVDLVNPMTLLYTHQQLEEAQQILKEYEHHGNTTTSTSSCSSSYNQVLWESKGIVEAMCHPDTHEIIPKPFRMAGFIPFNAPICLGALMATSPYSILFWQWSNQTHNALINYSNSNKSSTTSSTTGTCTIDGDDKEEESTSTSSSSSTMLQGYVGAVTGACGVSLGLKTFIDTNTSFNWSVVKKIKLQRYVALPAIAIGSAINVILMRRNELTTGINIYYENTDTTTDSIEIVTVGSSQVAATKALQEMTISRMLLAVPVFLLPPLGVSFMDTVVSNYSHSRALKRLMQKEKTLLVLNTFFVLLGFSIGLPATIALFPQIGSIPVNELEEQFQHIQDYNNNNKTDDGRRSIQVFKYNKGL